MVGSVERMMEFSVRGNYRILTSSHYSVRVQGGKRGGHAGRPQEDSACHAALIGGFADEGSGSGCHTSKSEAGGRSPEKGHLRGAEVVAPGAMVLVQL